MRQRANEILKRIGRNPMYSDQIRESFFKKGNGSLAARSSVSRFMSKLRRKGFVLKSYNDGKLKFCLSRKGALYLIEKFCLDISELIIETKESSVSVVGRKTNKIKQNRPSERGFNIMRYLASGPSDYDGLELFFFEGC